MSWEVLQADGTFLDIVLGFDQAKDYQNNAHGLGSIIGRYSNRIALGEFKLIDQIYKLENNDGNHHLHGGSTHFGTKTWLVSEIKDNQIAFELTSQHLESGYPGNMNISVVYSLTIDGALHIDYNAISDQDTLCNLTNHVYFNLSGESNGNVSKDHFFQINASHFLPTNQESIPTGVYQHVENTEMDLRDLRKLNLKSFDQDPLFMFTRSYDHNFVLGRTRKMRHGAHISTEKNSLAMDYYTNKPGVQFYLACFLEVSEAKENKTYHPFDGFCLESQFFPNSPNMNYFPSAFLKAGEKYNQKTIYKISRND